MKPFQDIRIRLAAATPGPYNARCKEFSNHALTEVWTEFGWYKELPSSYREPTTELFANAHTDIARLLAALDVAVEALEEIKSGPLRVSAEIAEKALKTIRAKCPKEEK